MPRACGLGIQGGIFHLTHRCHNKQHLLKFARDRDLYRQKLRQALAISNLALLDYCLTCNHVHLLVDTDDFPEVSRVMQKVAGETARAYNRRKDRINAFWGDNYHVTRVEGGEYLWRCLVYIELNMVRCGQVAHPRDWEWVGYREIMGIRSRYRILDLDRLAWRLGVDSIQDLRQNLEFEVCRRIAVQQTLREPWWTESLAVGRPSFLLGGHIGIGPRRKASVVPVSPDCWALQEESMAYKVPRRRSDTPT